MATFANASLPITGRWSSGGYGLVNPAGQTGANEAAALQIVDATSPLVTGVTTLTSTAGFRSSGGLINGGVAVANWGSGAPLIVRGAKNGKARAELNFFPPSSTVRADLWTGHGATIMANALLYEGACHSIVAKAGAKCPTGKTRWCDLVPIVATSAAQALAACQACYGTCYYSTADCAGAAYGPTASPVYGDAWYGYAAGCSGAAGRIFLFGSSYTDWGRWAP